MRAGYACSFASLGGRGGLCPLVLLVFAPRFSNHRQTRERPKGASARFSNERGFVLAPYLRGVSEPEPERVGGRFPTTLGGRACLT